MHKVCVSECVVSILFGHTGRAVCNVHRTRTMSIQYNFSNAREKQFSDSTWKTNVITYRHHATHSVEHSVFSSTNFLLHFPFDIFFSLRFFHCCVIVFRSCCVFNKQICFRWYVLWHSKSIWSVAVFDYYVWICVSVNPWAIQYKLTKRQQQNIVIIMIITTIMRWKSGKKRFNLFLHDFLPSPHVFFLFVFSVSVARSPYLLPPSLNFSVLSMLTEHKKCITFRYNISSNAHGNNFFFYLESSKQQQQSNDLSHE